MIVKTYHFLDCALQPSLRQLTRAGSLLALGERAFDLLLHLVANAGRVASRDELMQAVWGDAVVGDNNLNVQVAALRSLLGRDAVLTVTGRGLRFGHPVRAEVAADSTPAVPDLPSVAVLPFADMSAAATLAWLADSIVEDITTELSRFRDLFVVARNSAFSWRGKAYDVRDVARALGVRYIVEGSVRISGNEVRTTAQLIDASSGGHVWAENISSSISDTFATQARVATGVVTALAPQIHAAASIRMRRMPPADLNAYGLALAAWAIVSTGEMAFDRTPRDRAMELARSALAADPSCSLAYRVVAAVEWWHAYHGTTDDSARTVAAGVAAVDAALAIDALDHHAWRQKGLLAILAQDVPTGLTALRHAHDLNPNCAVTLAWLGMSEALHGEEGRAVAQLETALRLSPRDPARGEMLTALGFAQFAAHDYVRAAASAQAALLGMSNAAPPLVLATIAQIGSGDLAAGKASFAALQKTAPALAAERLAGRWLSTNDSYRIRALTFLKVAAGLAEPEAADLLR
ncbi:MAG: winged helix-turn-helix domain-containing protein [Burkholderiales bacterium]